MTHIWTRMQQVPVSGSWEFDIAWNLGTYRAHTYLLQHEPFGTAMVTICSLGNRRQCLGSVQV